jgi:hydroxymethylpyrimidine/phosphomethylpyrimidine kinase
VQPTTVLSIAGSDSGGGAGIQADLRTFAAFKVHGTTAITAVTAQNTLGVHDVAVLTTAQLRSQIGAVIDDFSVAGVKTGMLATPELVGVVAEFARSGLLANLVVDPVLVSSTNHLLLAPGGVEAYREELLPHATVVTPNLREAAVLCDIDVAEIQTVADMEEIARTIAALGPAAVLVKGGHFGGAQPTNAPDVLLFNGDFSLFDGPRVHTANDHGTGCSLSAAICSLLATGHSLPDACASAKTFVAEALSSAASWQLGRGRGPIDHLGWNRD